MNIDTWNGDIVFQELPNGIYAMVANRKGDIDDIIYDSEDLKMIAGIRDVQVIKTSKTARSFNDIF